MKTNNVINMKRRLNQKLLGKWVASVGGDAQATAIIIQTLRTSVSKAEKLASCRYERGIPYMEMKALAQLTSNEIDDLFPLVSASRGKAAS